MSNNYIEIAEKNSFLSQTWRSADFLDSKYKSDAELTHTLPALEVVWAEHHSSFP